MHRSIGALEFRVISKGIEVADEIVKKASVEIIYFKTICPGKFLVIIAGDVGEVEEAIRYGLSIGEETIVDHFIVHAISTVIVDAFKNKYESKEIIGAVGVLETNKVCAGIKALDEALKSSSVKLIKIQMAFAIGGKMIFVITGDLSAIEYGLKQAQTVFSKGESGYSAILSSPSEQVLEYLVK